MFPKLSPLVQRKVTDSAMHTVLVIKLGYVPLQVYRVLLKLVVSMEVSEARGENWTKLTRSLPKQLDWGRLEQQSSVNWFRMNWITTFYFFKDPFLMTNPVLSVQAVGAARQVCCCCIIERNGSSSLSCERRPRNTLTNRYVSSNNQREENFGWENRFFGTTTQQNANKNMENVSKRC